MLREESATDMPGASHRMGHPKACLVLSVGHATVMPSNREDGSRGVPLDWIGSPRGRLLCVACKCGGGTCGSRGSSRGPLERCLVSGCEERAGDGDENAATLT
jgi:hypothetical protein